MEEDISTTVEGGKQVYEDGWSEENWQEQMAEHPFFMKKIDPTKPLPPLVEALSNLKYDTELNTKRELAESYKEDGNNNFKNRKYF